MSECLACEVGQENWEGFCGYCQYLYASGALLHKHLSIKHPESVRQNACNQ